ncbi:MAG: hypothetical protein AB8H80_10405 [Planctomycetota bacterium]
MFARLFPARCPVDSASSDWLVYRLGWLVETFGLEAGLQSVLRPTEEDFPERFDGERDSLWPALERIAARLGVPIDAIDLNVYDKEDSHGDLMRASGLDGRWSSTGAAGFYFEGSRHYSINVERSVAKHPTSAVATLAHELCHALLLGGRHLKGDEEDGEPLTDLAAVFFGYGIFTANSLIRESSWHSAARSGWSVGRQGYLTFPIVGYALALHASLRAESRPRWGRYLRADARAPFRQGMRYLRQRGAGWQ